MVKNNVPKMVMYFLIKNVQDELSNKFYKDITTYDYNKLFQNKLKYCTMEYGKKYSEVYLRNRNEIR